MSTATGYDIPRARRPGPGAWAQLTLAEAKSVIRDTAGLIVPIGMPLLFLVMSGFSASTEILPGTGGRSVLELFVLPMMLVMVTALVGVVNMPSFLAGYRKQGLLKRLAATPARPGMLLAAQVLVSLAQTLIGVALAVAVAAAVFGLTGPARPLITVAVFLLICAAMYGLGVVVAALAPTPNAAVAFGLIAFFAIGAVGGMFGGTEMFPDALRALGEATPYGAGVLALQHAWAGESVPWQPLVALAVSTVAGVLFATRFFRWSR